mmetsp:Transcript_47712/g.83498  ORF Transcript_47712/g.83498 Transcript_47712/m.83498 type:complete len:204 (-) Transcript_47712:438-1049(-)
MTTLPPLLRCLNSLRPNSFAWFWLWMFTTPLYVITFMRPAVAFKRAADCQKCRCFWYSSLRVMTSSCSSSSAVFSTISANTFFTLEVIVSARWLAPAAKLSEEVGMALMLLWMLLLLRTSFAVRGGRVDASSDNIIIMVFRFSTLLVNLVSNNCTYCLRMSQFFATRQMINTAAELRKLFQSLKIITGSRKPQNDRMMKIATK